MKTHVILQNRIILVETKEVFEMNREQVRERKKRKIIAMAKRGKSTHEISRKFGRTFTKGQISAIKAHVTMGTYG